MACVHWGRSGKGKSWMRRARGVLPHGSQRSQSRDCAGLAVWPGRVPGALWVGYTMESLLASGFIVRAPAHAALQVPHSSPRRAQGRPVPSLTYLLIIPRAWGDWVTGRPPAGRRLAEMVRNQGREGARRCIQPPPGPLPYNLPEPHLLPFSLLS